MPRLVSVFLTIEVKEYKIINNINWIYSLGKRRSCTLVKVGKNVSGFVMNIMLNLKVKTV